MITKPRAYLIDRPCTAGREVLGQDAEGGRGPEDQDLHRALRVPRWRGGRLRSREGKARIAQGKFRIGPILFFSEN